MNQYRHIRYETFGHGFIKLTNLYIVEAPGFKPGITYPNGERLISIPTMYEHDPSIYAKRCIDRMYEHRDYYNELAKKRLRGDYKSRTGYTIEKMKEKV